VPPKHRIRLACGNGLRPDIWENFQRRFRIPKILEWYAATEGNAVFFNFDGKVGAVGFCWGGGAVNELAVNAPDLDAAVAYYGRQADPEDAAEINAPLLLHYAGQDERINAGIDAYKAALEAAGKEFTIHMYEGAQHAFNNDTSEARYNKEAADLAWGRTVAFFKEKLAA
jgi:carboxymethylenebutenolidase